VANAPSSASPAKTSSMRRQPRRSARLPPAQRLSRMPADRPVATVAMAVPRRPGAAYRPAMAPACAATPAIAPMSRQAVSRAGALGAAAASVSAAARTQSCTPTSRCGAIRSVRGSSSAKPAVQPTRMAVGISPVVVADSPRSSATSVRTGWRA
jgi:hypothetical protein